MQIYPIQSVICFKTLWGCITMENMQCYEGIRQHFSALCTAQISSICCSSYPKKKRSAIIAAKLSLGVSSSGNCLQIRSSEKSSKTKQHNIEGTTQHGQWNGEAPRGSASLWQQAANTPSNPIQSKRKKATPHRATRMVHSCKYSHSFSTGRKQCQRTLLDGNSTLWQLQKSHPRRCIHLPMGEVWFPLRSWKRNTKREPLDHPTQMKKRRSMVTWMKR